MNKRLKAPALLRLINRYARKHDLRVEQIPKRGKGSHNRHVILDASGTVVGRFELTGHPHELSWTVMRSTETALAHLFGEKWMEER